MNKKSIPYLILIIVFIFLTLFFGPIIANYNKTGSNTLLVNKDYSYLSRDQILSKIDQDFILPDHFILVLPNQQETSLKLATISAQINKNKIADTTGIGDTFCSTFVAGLEIYQGDFKKAMKLAMKNAASVLKKSGAQNGLMEL